MRSKSYLLTILGVLLIALPSAVLSAGKTIHAGTVTDASGSPLAGVTVEPVIHSMEPIIPTLSNEAGVFEITSSESIYLRFSKTGYLSKTVISPGDGSPVW